MKRILLVVMLLILAGVSVGTVSAQKATPSDNDVNAIAKQLFCPVCANTPLDVCPTQACAQWRELIREKLSEGWSEQQIKDYFVEQYGARVLAEPPHAGLNWLVYLVPPILFLAGAFLLGRSFMNWRKPALESAATETDSPAAKDDYLARVDDELKKRK
jgi:cytochrome c-type biogenesis protein CcmH